MPEPHQVSSAEDVKSVLSYIGVSDFVQEVEWAEDTNLATVKLKGSTVEGIYSLILLLVKGKLSNTNLVTFLGKTPLEKALVRQWVDFNLKNVLQNRVKSPAVLKELDVALGHQTLFAGNSLTLCDVLFYYTMYHTFETFSFEEKEKYPNLSRWFSLVQEDANLRQGRSKINFVRMPLYS